MNGNRSTLAALCFAVASCSAMAQMASNIQGSANAPVLKAEISSCFDFNVSTNKPDATLIVNNNPGGPYPVQVFMGEMDPNLIRVEGQPNAIYRVFLYECGSTTASISVIAKARLNANGVDEFLVAPETFMRDEAFALWARVDSKGAPSGISVSGASQVRVVPTMASDIDLTLPVGSLADIRGPVMAVDAQTVSVGNLVYGVTAKTEYSNGINSLADLSLGDWIVIDGQLNSAGGFDAKEINVEDTENQVRVAGRVQGTGPAGFAMLGVSFYTSSETTYFDVATGMWTTYDALVPGMAVEVRLPVEAAFPTVTIVRLNVPTEPEPEPEPESEEEEEIEDEDPPPPLPPFCS